jgi:uncharacterized protein YdeI (YjbR/CyaY-like superfamily)
MPRSPSRPLAHLKQVYVENRAAWRGWLAENCARSPGIWLVFDKKASRPDRLAYGDAVEEALCHGWIDSTVRTLDDARYEQLFTPRKPTSTWSRVNKDRVARMIAQGLMADAGLAAIERAKANGRWTSLDAVEALVMPDDLATALRRTEGAAAGFDSFSRSNRKVYLYWVNQAVRPETRARRVAEVVRRAASNLRNRHLESPPVAKGSEAPSGATSAKSARTAKTARTAKSAKSAKTAKSAKSAKTARKKGTARSSRPSSTRRAR